MTADIVNFPLFKYRLTMADSPEISVLENCSTSELSQLRGEIEADLTDLKRMVVTGIYTKRVCELNQCAKQSIDNFQSGEALVYLNEAERILEYAAGCGKSIARNIIICVLHNQACAYQKLCQLPKCISYLQALIYNHTNQSQPAQPLTSSIQNKDSLQRYTTLCKYNLQFCSVNSQMSHHDTALTTARKSITLASRIFHFLSTFKMGSSHEENENENKTELELKLKMVNNLAAMRVDLQPQMRDKVREAAQYFVGVWRARLKDKSQEIKPIEEQFKGYAMVAVMELQPMPISTQHLISKKDVEIDSISFKSVMEKLLLTATSYFTVAVELRLLELQEPKDTLCKHSCEQQESQLYHLMAIALIAVHVPFQILLMKHFLKSYENQYGLSLAQSHPGCPSDTEKYVKFLFGNESPLERNNREDIHEEFGRLRPKESKLSTLKSSKKSKNGKNSLKTNREQRFRMSSSENEKKNKERSSDHLITVQHTVNIRMKTESDQMKPKQSFKQSLKWPYQNSSKPQNTRNNLNRASYCRDTQHRRSHCSRDSHRDSYRSKQAHKRKQGQQHCRKDKKRKHSKGSNSKSKSKKAASKAKNNYVNADYGIKIGESKNTRKPKRNSKVKSKTKKMSPETQRKQSSYNQYYL